VSWFDYVTDVFVKRVVGVDCLSGVVGGTGCLTCVTVQSRCETVPLDLKQLRSLSGRREPQPSVRPFRHDRHTGDDVSPCGTITGDDTPSNDTGVRTDSNDDCPTDDGTAATDCADSTDSCVGDDSTDGLTVVTIVPPLSAAKYRRYCHNRHPDDTDTTSAPVSGDSTATSDTTDTTDSTDSSVTSTPLPVVTVVAVPTVTQRRSECSDRILTISLVTTQMSEPSSQRNTPRMK